MLCLRIDSLEAANRDDEARCWFRIGKDIRVCILKVHRDRSVTIGIQAPNDVNILRETVFQEIFSQVQKGEKK